jgi:arylsulfatase A-like enzyme
LELNKQIHFDVRPIVFGMAATIPLTALTIQVSGQKPKPNVLFILLDDLGYADLGCYGSSFYETPNIDRLCSSGLRFTNAYAACPVSSPTRAAIMTGRYPVSTGITDWIPGRQASNSGSPSDKYISLPFRQQLELSEITIAEKLKANGYSTMISGKWHLGSDEKYWPENQGFDVNIGGYGAGSPARNKSSDGYFSPYGNPRLKDGPKGEYLTDRQTDEALKFIAENKNRPFFLYLSYYAVHNPMQCKEELVRKFSRKADSIGISGKQQFTREREWIKEGMNDKFRERILQGNPVYAAMIYSVDQNIGRIIKFLDDSDLLRNTVVIFTSDNGGLSTSEGSPTCNAPLRAGKGWLYEGGIRVPLIIYSSDSKLKGKNIDTPVSSIDYFPTICQITGTDYEKGQVDGISILPLMSGKKIARRALFWHYPHYSNQGVEPGSAVRMGRYKLIDNYEKERQELYDLESDISEMNDISASNPEKTRELSALLTNWRQSAGAKMVKPNPAWKGVVVY